MGWWCRRHLRRTEAKPIAEASLDGASGAHSWVIGLAFQHDHYQNDRVPDFNFTYNVPGLFVQDEYRWGDSLTLSTSARADQHSRYGTFFSPRAAMLWRPGGAA